MYVPNPDRAFHSELKYGITSHRDAQVKCKTNHLRMFMALFVLP